MKVVKPYTSIRTALITAALTAVFFVFLFFYFGVSIRSYIYDDSKEIAKEVSRKAAKETEQMLTSALMSARAMGIRVMLVRELGGGREMVRSILKSTVEHNSNYLGAWTLWEPNAFDAKDRLFRGDSLHNNLGSLGAGFFRFNNKVNMEVMSENDYHGSYYLSVKYNLKEQIVEPYRWRYTGQTQLFFGTSISVPLTLKGEFLGAIGIDIDLSNLNRQLNEIRPYKTGSLALIANNGTIVSHIDSTLISKDFFKICEPLDMQVLQAISSGEEFTQEVISEFTRQKVFRFFYPINIGGSKPWSMMVEIPIKDATSRTSQMIVVASVILVVGLGVILFLIFNIIDRRRYENALLKAIAEVEENGRVAEENARNYREIFNSTSEAILVYDTKIGKLYDVNEVALKLYGYTAKAEMLKLNVNDLSSGHTPYSGNDASHFLYKALTQGPQVFEWKSRRRDNEVFWSEVSLRSAIINGSERILAIVRDITEKKNNEEELEKYRHHLEFLVKERTEELEASNEELTAINEELYDQRTKLQDALTDLRNAQEQLIQSEKLASLGVLASGIAHEINNPLNFIHGGITAIEKHFLKSDTHQLQQISPLIDAIKEGVRRSVDIVSSLNLYTRKDNHSTTECNIHRIIDSCLVMLHGEIKERIEIKKEYNSDLGSIHCSDSKLQQAFLNILLNAVQAIDEEGQITIKTSGDSKRIKVTITDTGCGISSDNLQRVTDPFYTTKDPGKGIGLGLSITQTIIADHRGNIKIQSEEGKGTTVVVSLPSKSRDND